MSSKFMPLEIPPGVVAKATKKMRSSNWAEVNCVRWVEGQMNPIGGQAQYNYAFASRCKRIHSWYGLDEVLYIAYLCEANLYVDVGGTLVDITPFGGIVPPAPPATGGFGDGPFSADTFGTPRVISTIQALDKTPDAFSLANFGAILYAMTSPDGRLLMWDPSVGPPGVAASIAVYTPFAVGYAGSIQMAAHDPAVQPGMSVFNATSNLPIGTVLSFDSAPTLTLTANALNPGAANDILQFGNPAIVQPADSGRGPVPTGRLFVVTQERFLMIFGSTSDGTVGGGSFRRFAWCDQENPGAWDYSDVTSQAGFLDIEPASPIVAALATRSGVLFWTGKKAYVSQFLGAPYIYNYVELAEACTPWSPQSAVNTAGLALWFSQQGVFSFDGTSIMPVACNVRPWIDDDIDLLNVRFQACAVHVANFSEFWWFFPQDGQPGNTRAVIYCYKEGWWGQARMARSAGITSNYASHTIMADGLVAYEHEAGNVYPTDVALPWAETFDLNLNSGARLTTIKQLLPDVEGDITNLLYSIFYRNSRSTGTPELQTIPQPVRSDGYVDLRTTGRDIRLRIALAGPQVLPVTVGQHLVDSVARGDR
jgi:hypothetical protein